MAHPCIDNIIRAKVFFTYAYPFFCLECRVEQVMQYETAISLTQNNIEQIVTKSYDVREVLLLMRSHCFGAKHWSDSPHVEREEEIMVGYRWGYPTCWSLLSSICGRSFLNSIIFYVVTSFYYFFYFSLSAYIGLDDMLVVSVTGDILPKQSFLIKN